MRNHFILVLMMLGLCGCRAPYIWPAFNVAEPGWTVSNGQAVWKPLRSMPELTGDVLIAMNTNGSAFIEFNKTIPFATARLDGQRWQIEFPSDHRLYAGHYPLPKHFAWLQLPSLLNGVTPRRPWKGSLQAEGETKWELENPRTGETLQGYLAKP